MRRAAAFRRSKSHLRNAILRLTIESEARLRCKQHTDVSTDILPPASAVRREGGCPWVPPTAVRTPYADELLLGGFPPGRADPEASQGYLNARASNWADAPTPAQHSHTTAAACPDHRDVADMSHHTTHANFIKLLDLPPAWRNSALTTLTQRLFAATDTTARQGGPEGSLAFRFLVAVDIEGFSQHPAAGQARVQDDLEDAMAEAAASTDLDRRRWYRQPRGDGELDVLPQDADGLSLVARYPRALAATVAAVNHARKSGPRLRLRMAIHHGAVAPGQFGPVGAAPVAISRLLDAKTVRQQLRQRSDLDVALIVSAYVYDEVIQSRLCDLNPEAFRRTTIKAKGNAYVGYLYQDIIAPRERMVPARQQPMTAQLTMSLPPQDGHANAAGRSPDQTDSGGLLAKRVDVARSPRAGQSSA